MANLPEGFVADAQPGLPEGFVPDAPEEGGPESFLDPKKFKPSPIHRKLKNTGPIEQVRAENEAVREGFPTVEESVTAPVYSLIDHASLGGLSAGLNAVSRSDRPVMADSILRGIDRYRRLQPTIAGITDMAGLLTGGPAAIAEGVEQTIPRVVNPLAQAARAIVGAGVSSGIMAGSEAAIRGEDLPEVARETGRGYVGGTAVGAPLTAGGMLLRGAANTVLGSKGAKAREYLDARGQPLTAQDTSDAAIGAAAQRTDDAVKSAMADYKDRVASGPYREEIAKVGENDWLRQRLGLPAMKDQPVDVTSIVANMAKAIQRPGIRPEAEAELRRQMDKALANYTPGSGPIMMSQEYLNELRQSLGTAARFDTTDPKLSPIKQAFNDAKALVDKGPYAEANRRFSTGLEDLNNSLDMVGLETSRDVDEPIKGNLRVKAQRAGQNTVTAGADTEALDIDAFKAKHPELANDIDAPEILRRQGDLSFNMTGPSHGGFIERHGVHLSPFVAAAIAASGHGLKGAAAIPLALALQNRNAIAGRLLYGPAQEAQLGAQLLLGQVPQLSAPGSELAQEHR